jgi:6-phosphogluconolactonase (cycloisomerase 2 family)
MTIALLQAAASTAQAQRTLYVSADSPSSGLYTAAIDLESGTLTQVPGSTVSAGSTPVVPTVSPDGSRLYVPDYYNSELHGYSLNPSSGAPTELSGSPVATDFFPNAAVFKPDGSAVFTANFGGSSVGSWLVASNGDLSPVPGAPFAATGFPTTLAASPVVTQMYATGYYDDVLNGFSFGPAAGALDPISGFPAASPDTLPVDVEFSPDAKFLYVLGQGNGDLSSFAVDASTGALSPAGTSVTLADTPNAIAASPNGRWVATAAQDDTVTIFAASVTGQLTQVGSPVPIGGDNPNDIAFSPDSRFVYTSNLDSGDVSGLAIDQSGAATPVAGSPFNFPGGPAFSLAVSPDQAPTASFGSAISASTASFDASASSDSDGTVETYNWDFGDGVTATTSTPTANHTYAASGTYVTTLTVADNENCSTDKIGTGQTISCNGSSAAQTNSTVMISATPPTPPSNPLVLSNVSVKEYPLRRGETRRRVISRYSLNRKAGVTIQFQKVNRGRVVNGKCRYETSSNMRKRKCAHVRSYGNPVKLRGNPGSNRKTFVRTFGGKAITRGRYRQVSYAADGSITKSKTLFYGYRVQGK